jgi:hypothetical protein
MFLRSRHQICCLSSFLQAKEHAMDVVFMLGFLTAPVNFRGSCPALIPLPCTAPVWNFWSSSLRVPRRRCSRSDLRSPAGLLAFLTSSSRLWFLVPIRSAAGFVCCSSICRAGAVARFSCAWILPVSSSDFLASLIPARATQCSALAAGSQLVKPQVAMQFLGLQLACLAPGVVLRFLNSLRHRRP